MPESTRLCIKCGREIGMSATCPNPACEDLPNFYRDFAPPAVRPTGGAKRKRKPATPAGPRASGTTGDTRGTVVMPGPGAGATRHTVLMDEERQPVAILRRLAEPRREFLIHTGITDVGARPPAHVILDEPEVSSSHARISCEHQSPGGAVLIVTDLDSTNGTFVNGQRIERCVLKDGDQIRFASAEFRMSLLEK